jgi:hypothetical protein
MYIGKIQEKQQRRLLGSVFTGKGILVIMMRNTTEEERGTE